jgi:hypothetical protein
VPYAIAQASAFAYCCRQEPRLFKLGQPEASAPGAYHRTTRRAPPPSRYALRRGFAPLKCKEAHTPLTSVPPPPLSPLQIDNSLQHRVQVSWLAKECFVLADKDDATLFQKLNVGAP